MNINPDLALKVISVALSLGAIIYAWFATRNKDVDDRFDSIDERFHTGSKRMDAHDLDILALQKTVASQPDKDDFHQLQLMMVEMGGDMKAMLQSMDSLGNGQKRLERTVGSHENFLRGDKT